MADNNSTLHVELKATDNISKAVKSAQSSLIRFVGAVSSAIVSIKAISFPVESSADFERALADVAKTTNFTALEMDTLSASLINMSKNMSLTALELANIAATAGQLGLGGKGVEAIEQFTESVARATVTFGLGEQQVSQYAAQILQIFNIPTDQVENVFSQINELSNNSVASAEFLLDVMRRVGSIAGLTSQEVGALAASVADFGVTAEVGGTTLVKIFANMETKAGDFARVLNTTTQEWATAVQTAPLQAFQRIARALNDLDSQSRSSAIKELFGSGRIFSLAQKFVNDAANDFEILNKNITNSNDAFQSGTSSIDEYEKVVTSFNEQLKILKNSFTALAIESGQALLPALKEIVKELQTFLDSEGAKDAFEALIQSLGGLIQAIRDGVKVLAEYSGVWRNLLPILKTFIALGIGRALLHIVDGIGAAVVKVGALSSGWAGATRALKEYYSKSLTFRSKQEIAEKAEKRAAAGIVDQIPQKARLKSIKDFIKEGKKDLEQTDARIKQEKELVRLGRQRAAQEFKTGNKAAAAALRDEARLRIQNIRLLQEERRERLESTNKNIYDYKVVKGLAVDREEADRKAAKAAKNLAAAQTRAGGASGRLAAGAKAATGALKLLGTTARLVGGLISTVLGPLGTIATLFFIFKDEIISFFGFVTDEGDKAAEAATRRYEKRMEQYAKSLVASYKKIADKYKSELGGRKERDLFSPSTDAPNLDQLFGQQPVEEYKKAVESVALSFKDLSTGAKGGEIRILQLSESMYEVQAESNRVREQIQKLIKEREKLEESGQDSRGRASYIDKARINEIDKQVAELSLAFTKVQELQKDYEKQLAEAEATQRRIVDERDSATSQLAGRFTENTKNYVDAVIEQQTLLRQLQELNEKRKELSQDKPSRSRGPSRSGDTELAKTEEQFKEVAKAAEEAEKKVKAYGSVDRNTGLETQLIKTIDALGKTEQGLQTLTALSKAASNGIQDAALQQEILLNKFVEKTTALAATKEVQKAFIELTGTLSESIARAKGVYANIAGSTNAAAKATRELGRELRALVQQQEQDAATQNAFSALEKQSDDAFQSQKNFFEDLIALRERAGDTAGVERAREDLAALEEQKNTELEIEKVKLRREAIDARINKINTDSKKILEEQQKLSEFDIKTFVSEENAKKLKNASRELTEAEKEALVTAKLLEIQRDSTYNTEQLEDYKKEISKLYDETINLANTRQIDPITGLLDEGILTAAQRTELANQGEIIGQELDKGIKRSNVLQNVATEKAEAYVNARAAPIETEIQKLNTELKGLQGVLGLSEDAITSLGIAINNAVGNLVGTFEGTDYADLVSALKAQSGILQAVNTLPGEEVNFDKEFLESTGKLLGFKQELIDAYVTESDKFIANLELVRTAQQSALTSLTEKIKSDPITQIELDKIEVDLAKTLEDFSKSDASKIDVNAKIVVNIDDAKKELETLYKILDTDFNVEITSKTGKSFAGGGYVRGPGSTTSDSILSWLSDKEYVIQAAAVRKFGVGFFDQINNLRLPKFATGGLVQSKAIASSIGGQRDVIDLNFNVGGNVYPVSGDRQVVQSLASALAAMSRGAT